MNKKSSWSAILFCIVLAGCGGGGGSSDTGSNQTTNNGNGTDQMPGSNTNSGGSAPGGSGTTGTPADTGTGSTGNSSGGGTTTSPSVNGSPAAALTVVTVADLKLSVDASGSTAQSGNIASYAWDFGDGQSATGVTATHVYGSSGTYTVKLTVTDSNGLSNTVSAPVKVTASVQASLGDPYYARQWHLKNTGQTGNNGAIATQGEDIHVEPVWESCNDNGTCKGEGINIAVVDTGIETTHEDLKANISTVLKGRIYPMDGSPVDGDPLPSSGIANFDPGHGTYVSGLIAARDNNGIGVRGVAPRASLVGYRLLTNPSTINMVDAMTYQASQIAVSNNSWTLSDESTAQLQYPDTFWQSAIDTGHAKGRGGLGTIYVFGGGNGAYYKHRSDYDGFANYKGVIAVGSTNANGKKARYSSPGSNLWISAPGGDGCDLLGLTTTDLTGTAGLNNPNFLNQYDLTIDLTGNYTQCVAGTSAAAPLVSGAAALVVQANPALTWRDVHLILAASARKNDPNDAGWTTNAAGFHINDKYGFGVVDAAAAVALARTWTNVATQKSAASLSQTVNLSIPDNSPTGVNATITMNNTGINSIEWVDVTLTVDHPYSGDLQIILTSPSGTQSVLADTRQCLTSVGADPVSKICTAYDGWRFGVARLLGEKADGNWKIAIRDGASGNTGVFKSWQVSVYGH